MNEFSPRLQSNHPPEEPNMIGQGTENPPAIAINDYELEAVHEFTYRGSIVSGSLSPEAGINRCIEQTSTTLSRLTTGP